MGRRGPRAGAEEEEEEEEAVALGAGSEGGSEGWLEGWLSGLSLKKATCEGEAEDELPVGGADSFSTPTDFSKDFSNEISNELSNKISFSGKGTATSEPDDDGVNARKARPRRPTKAFRERESGILTYTSLLDHILLPNAVYYLLFIRCEC
mmetsp:Transcript_33873/g.78217  ORF Transcript_33873/g.78217 Transcript_33873/m.78217 type:complete len:151 (-) Transcript_33873:37-489(-)